MNDLKISPREELENFKKGLKKIVNSTFFIILAIFASYTSYYIVDTDEEAVVIRLGKYYKTETAGLHFKLPYLDQIQKIKKSIISNEEFGFRTIMIENKNLEMPPHKTTEKRFKEALMLSGDMKIVDVEWVVQYKVSNPFDYLFKTKSPITNIRAVSESAMRRIVGNRSFSQVSATNREEIVQDVQKIIQENLDRYSSGVQIVSVKLQSVNSYFSFAPALEKQNKALESMKKSISTEELKI